MERHQSRTTDLPPARRGSSSDRDWDTCGASLSVEAWTAAALTSGPASRKGGGIQPSGRDSVEPGVCRPSDSLREQLQAIRRRLWIVNGALESLSAKIELAHRRRCEVAGPDGPDLSRHSSNPLGDERLAPQSEGLVGRWWARRKLAWLRSRADRAERRAAAAISGASVSFGTALEAVLQAAIARVKADEACLNSGLPPAPRRCDCGDDRATIDHRETP